MAKKSKAEELEEYQNSPEYTGYEDYSIEGRKAIAAYNKSAKENKYADQKRSSPSKSGVKAAAAVIKEHKDKMKPLERVDEMGNAYKKGGTASSRADGCAQRGKTKGRMV
jgi:hypothetical protein